MDGRTHTSGVRGDGSEPSGPGLLKSLTDKRWNTVRGRGPLTGETRRSTYEVITQDLQAGTE